MPTPLHTNAVSTHRPIFVLNTGIQVNYWLLYCVAATCHGIVVIVNVSSYRVAESSKSFTESSCPVTESSCHRIGQLTNRPVSF